MKRQSSSAAKGKARPKQTIPKRPYRPTVDKDMNVMDAIALHPKATDILAAYGLHCFQCAFNTLDSIEAGAKSHGLTDVDIENIVMDMQELLDSTPPKPEILILTIAAAKALKHIAKTEKQKSVCLRVTTDGSGGFCMEFTGKPFRNDRVFICKGVKDVALIASGETLWRIGGSTVDFREGRFKLDIEQNEECGCKGSCKKCEST